MCEVRGRCQRAGKLTEVAGHTSIVVSGTRKVAVGISGLEFCSCIRAEIVSRDALIFAISLCTRDWQLQMSSRSGGRCGEVAKEQHPDKLRGGGCC